MAEDPENEARYRDFWMQLFCFPNPEDPNQRLAIRSIGSVENEMQAVYMKMSDVDKLITCRRNVQDVTKSKRPLKGSASIRSLCFRQRLVHFHWEDTGPDEGR
jgi:hypothetical protein